MKKGRPPAQRGESWAVRQAEGFRNRSFQGAAGQRPLDLEPDEVIGDVSNLAAGGYTSPKANGSQRKIVLLFGVLPVTLFLLVSAGGYGLSEWWSNRDTSIKPVSGGECLVGTYRATFDHDAFEDSSQSFRVTVTFGPDSGRSIDARDWFLVPADGAFTEVELSADTTSSDCEVAVAETVVDRTR